MQSACELLTSAQAATRLGIRPGTLTVWRQRGIGPAYVRCGGTIRYRESDVEAYLRKQSVPEGRAPKHGEKEWRATVRSVYSRPPREPWSSPHGRVDKDTGEQQQGHGQARAEGDWLQPEPLGEALPPVMAFDERFLPTALRPLVVDAAERMQVPIDFPAAAAMLCLAGAVNRRALVQPKNADPSWTVVPNLWGAAIGPPGFMKTPALQALTRTLNRIQAGWHAEHADAMRQYAQEKEEFDLRLAAWRPRRRAGQHPPGR